MARQYPHDPQLAGLLAEWLKAEVGLASNITRENEKRADETRDALEDYVGAMRVAASLLQFREDECQRLRAGIVDSRR